MLHRHRGQMQNAGGKFAQAPARRGGVRLDGRVFELIAELAESSERTGEEVLREGSLQLGGYLRDGGGDPTEAIGLVLDAGVVAGQLREDVIQLLALRRRRLEG